MIKVNIPLIGLTLALLLLAAGCSLPRIIVLDDPLSDREHLELGMAYEKDGRLELAAAEYQSAAESLPLASLYLGNIRFLQKDYAAAERAYRKALQKLPDNPRPRNNLAWLYYTRSIKLAEAESLARQALHLAQKNGLDPAPYQDTLSHILRHRRGD